VTPVSTRPDVFPCGNCGQFPGVRKWSNWPDGRMAALWCEPCVIRKQIEHAEERAAALPGLRARLLKVESELRSSEVREQVEASGQESDQQGGQDG
jgi:hypothetical protein